MTDVRIVTVDPHDDAALRAWYAVESASVHHERPFALQRSLTALAASVQHPSAWADRILLAATGGEHASMIAVAEVVLSTSDNPHLAELEINVHPEHRRAGVGSALHEAADRLRREHGRTTVVGELYEPVGAAAPGKPFAAALGYTSAHEEEHLAMRLPADPRRVEAMTRPVPGYEVVTWQGACPDEHIEAYVAMRNQMNQDAPSGDVDVAPTVLDEERLRTSEERLARSYVTVVAAARRTSDGAMGGYSLVFLDRSSDVALQDDTLVMPEHRGLGLGLQLKLATLAVIEAEHQQRTALHTWTDPGNAAMYRTNLTFGYARVEVMHEMQRVD